MTIWMTVITWALAVACLSAVLYWGGAVVLTWRARQARMSVQQGLDASIRAGDWPTVSVIVPVHNGAGTIDECAKMLRTQHYPGTLKFVFVIDRCTDDTAGRLQLHAADDPRIVTIQVDACPADWSGKCHAAWIGAQQATGDWLLFTDVDTSFDPNLVRAAVGMAVTRKMSLLTVLSMLRFHHVWERVVQPVAVMHLMRLFPLDRVDRGVRSRPFANGQFLLFRREIYDRIGGHAAVRNRLLEDIALAHRVHRCDGRTAVAMGDGMLACTMYDSMDAFWAGWKRILIEACGRKPRRLRKNGTRLLIFGPMMPLLQLAALGAASMVLRVDVVMTMGLVSLVIIGLALQATALLGVYRWCGAPLLAVLGYPWGSWGMGRLLHRGAADLEQGRPLVWGNRAYVLEPRGDDWSFTANRELVDQVTQGAGPQPVPASATAS